MKELACQIKNWLLVPFALEDRRKLKSAFKDNQLVRVKVTGTTVHKARSWKQLARHRVLCRLCAENVISVNKESLDHEDKVHEMCKLTLGFIDKNKTLYYDGKVHFVTQSISYDNADHYVANGFFQQADELIAEWLNTTPQGLERSLEYYTRG